MKFARRALTVNYRLLITVVVAALGLVLILPSMAFAAINEFTLNQPYDGATINKPYPYFSWDPASDSGPGIAYYQLYINNEVARDYITNWTAAVPSKALGNGSYTWFIRAWDNAGNFRDSATRSFTVSAGVGKIAFVSNRDGNPEIYIMNTDGSNQTRLTNNGSNDDSPAMSSDGAKIAFASTRPIASEIYVINVDGSNEVRITNNTAADWNPCYSPDGSKIVFDSERDGNEEIYIMNSDGSNPTRLTNNTAFDGEPVFSADGSRIIFQTNRNRFIEIWIMNIDGSNQTRLTVSDNGQHPATMPDGLKIAFDSGSPTQIRTMNIDGTNQTNLSNNTSWDFIPTFSPDNRKIAFCSTRAGSYDVYSMNSDGSGQVNLTNNPATDYNPSWGPTVAENIPPSIPQNLSAAPISSTQIDLSWDMSDSSGVSGYIIYNGDNQEIARTTYTQFSFRNLTPDTIYSYYVKAYNSQNSMSEKSETVSARTFASSTGHVESGQDVNAVFDNGSSITFDNVSSPGDTAISGVEPRKPAPEQFRFTQNGYYSITMTGTYSGNITITLPYDASLEEKEDVLKVFHYKEPGGWEEVTPLSFNTTNHTVTFTTTSLSDYAIVMSSSSSSSSVGFGMNTNLLLILSGLLILAGKMALLKGRFNNE